MRCLILLLLVGRAFAQPEWYAVWNSHYTIRDHEICVRGDTVDVLYSGEPFPDNDSLVFTHFSYNIALTHLGAEFNYALPSPNYYSDFIDMTAISPQQWACLLHMNTRGNSWGYGQFFFNTKLLHGNSREINSIDVESSSYSDFPDHHSGSWTHGHALRINHDLLDVAYYVADIGQFDVWYTASVIEYDNDFDVVHSTAAAGYFGGPYVETGNRVAATRIPGDSILALTASPTWGVQAFVGPWSEIENGDHTRLAPCPYANLREFYLTGAGRIVAVFDDETLRQIIPGEEGTAECVEFASMELDDANAWAFHPNYGFAAIQALPGYLLLARIDTSGNEVQPVGVLYETDGTSFIVDADVTISDSGEVIAVWSEYTDWNEGPHVLKIAWTDWATFLDTPEQQAPAIPREISLSSYPNPFNSTVTIQYDLPQAGHVSLSIFDIRGRLVETLRDDFAPSGSHTQSWSPTELASGVYFARLNVGQVQNTTKLLYLK